MVRGWKGIRGQDGWAYIISKHDPLRRRLRDERNPPTDGAGQWVKSPAMAVGRPVVPSIGRSVGRSRCRLISGLAQRVGWSVVQSASRSVGRSLCLSVFLYLVGRYVGRSVDQSVSWSVGRTIGLSVCQSVVRSVDRLVGRSVARPVGQSVYRSICLAVGESAV